MPPASMAKMMTTDVAFELIDKGQLPLNKMCTVRPETWQKWHGPAGRLDHVPVAERAGQRRESAERHRHSVGQRRVGRPRRMHRRDRAGLHRADERARQAARPHQQPFRHRQRLAGQGRDLCHRARPRDARPGEIEHHPKLYKKFYSQPSFTWGKTLGSGQDITQANRNPILGKVPGADGLKTGHTDEAGYGFTGSAEQNGRRLIEVVAGLGSWNERVQESTRLMQWGFNAWQAKPLFQAGRQGRHGQGPAGQQQRSAAGRAAQPRGDRARRACRAARPR